MKTGREKWVRPILTVMFAGSVCYAFLFQEDKISTDAFLVMAGSAVTWWYKSRDDQKKP